MKRAITEGITAFLLILCFGGLLMGMIYGCDLVVDWCHTHRIKELYPGMTFLIIYISMVGGLIRAIF